MKRVSFKKNRLRHALSHVKNAGLAASVSSSVFLYVNPALAQDEAEPELETVEVIGSFSGSLNRSLEVKREQETIADAVVAADIGKLPAVNIAEALQRVPGVSIVREAGEGQFISVRGLGPNFQAVTLNGMPLAYNENIRTSGQSGRQFRFRVLPADLIDGIVVSKAPSANMMEGGIGSNVDIRTLNPLERDAFFSGTVESNYEERTGTLSPKGSLAAGWQNSSGTFGLMGGISYQEREVQFERLGIGSGTLPDDYDYGNNTFLKGIVVHGDFQTTLEQEKRDRTSAVAGFQWRPLDNLELDMDLLYSQFNNEIAERRLTYQTWGYFANLDPKSAVIRDGELVAGTINGGRIRNTTEFSDQAHENLIFITGLTYDLGDWHLEPKLSVSRATSDLDTPLQRIEFRTADKTGNITFDVGSNPVENGRIRALYTDLDLTNPLTVPFRRYRIRPMNSEDEDITFKFDASRALDVEFASVNLTQLQFGFQVSNRARDYQRRDRSAMALRGGLEMTDEFVRALNGVMVPGNTFDQTIDQGQLWASANWDLWRSSYVIKNEDGTVEFDGVEPSASALVPTEADLQNSYGVDEDIRAFYARLDFSSEFNGVPFSGNFGLRAVETESQVTGTLSTIGTNSDGEVVAIAIPRTSNNTYRELLPSLNLNFEVTDDVLMRLAAGRTMTRPSLSELRDVVVPNSGTVSDIYTLGAKALEDGSLDLTAKGGNPYLEPYTSWNLDISLEWYFDEFGAFSAAAFYKDVDNYISTDFETRTLPFAVNDGSVLPVSILISSPANIGDVTIAGMEFGFTTRLPMGLGIAATATFATSKLELDKSDVGVQTAGIQGISDRSFSISPFYEMGPLEVNLSYTWRSDYLTDSGVVVTSQPTEEDAAAFYQKGYGTMDMGGSYNFGDSYSVFMQAVNILENHPTTYVQSKSLVHQIHYYGRTINVGFRAKF